MNNIIHFLSEGVSLKDINTIMKNKNEQYYTVEFNDRKELHIVKYNEGYFKVNEMIIQLFEFYKKNKINLDNNITIKGNNEFAIIYNVSNSNLINRIKNDLNVLLKK